MPILIARPFFYNERTHVNRKRAYKRTGFCPGEESCYVQQMWDILLPNAIGFLPKKGVEESISFTAVYGSAIDGDTLVPAIEVKDGPGRGFILRMTAECYALHHPHECSHPECETMVQLTGYCQKCKAHICPEHLVTREPPEGHEPEDHWRER